MQVVSQQSVDTANINNDIRNLTASGNAEDAQKAADLARFFATPENGGLTQEQRDNLSIAATLEYADFNNPDKDNTDYLAKVAAMTPAERAKALQEAKFVQSISTSGMFGVGQAGSSIGYQPVTSNSSGSGETTGAPGSSALAGASAGASAGTRVSADTLEHNALNNTTSGYQDGPSREVHAVGGGDILSGVGTSAALPNQLMQGVLDSASQPHSVATGYVEPNGGYENLGGSSSSSYTPSYTGSADTAEHYATGYVEPNGGYENLGGTPAPQAQTYQEPQSYASPAPTSTGYVEPNGGYENLGGTPAPSVDSRIAVVQSNGQISDAVKNTIIQQINSGNPSSAQDLIAWYGTAAGEIPTGNVTQVTSPYAQVDPALQAKYNMIDNTAYSANVKQQAKAAVAAGNNAPVMDILAFCNGGAIGVQTPAAISIPSSIPPANSSSTPSAIPAGAGSVSTGFKS